MKVTEDVHFTGPTGENIFDVAAEDIRIDPGSYFDADRSSIQQPHSFRGVGG